MANFESNKETDGKEVDEKRPQFGNRLLTDQKNVFEHNAWDNVVWDDEQEQEAREITERQLQCPMPDKDQEKCESDAHEYWNSFYGIHQNRFFKDRHWLFTEFPELLPESNDTTDKMTTTNDVVITESLGSNIGQSVTVSCNDANTGQETCAIGTDISENMTACSIDTHTQCDETKTVPSTSSNNIDDTHDTVSTEPSSGDVNNYSSSATGEKLDSDREIGEDAGRVTHGRVEESNSETYPGATSTYRILEVGCGVGNTVFPILVTNNDPDLMVYCCDFSSTAVNLVKENPDYNASRCCAFVCDISDEGSSVPFPDASLDVIILIFVLSAVHPDKMQTVIDRLARYLKPGGMILFRDYGRYDMAQLRFKKGRCLSENFYARGDGTRVYFFTQDELREIMTRAGLVEKQNLIDRRLQVNRGKQLKMYRVWIQCKYVKPLQTIVPPV